MQNFAQPPTLSFVVRFETSLGSGIRVVCSWGFRLGKLAFQGFRLSGWAGSKFPAHWVHGCGLIALALHSSGEDSSQQERLQI